MAREAKEKFKWLNDALQSARSTFNRQQPNPFILFNAPLTDGEYQHVYDMMVVELGFVSRDAVAVYDILDKNFNQSVVYPHKYRYIIEHAVSMQDVIMQYFLRESVTYSKIQLEDGQYVVIAREPSDNNTLKISVGNTDIEFPVVASCVVAGVGGRASNRLLHIAFSILAMAYSALSSGSRLSRKIVFQIDGLSAILEKIADKRNGQDDFMANLVDQGRSILSDDVAFLDAGTKISLLPLDFEKVAKAIDLALDEISRITKIPKTKMRGTSPVGMNATGEYDDKNYQDILQSLRNTVVEPFLDILEYKYRKQVIADMDSLSKAMTIKLQMDAEDDTITLAGKQKLSEILLAPYLDTHDFVYTNGYQERMRNHLEYPIHPLSANHSESEVDDE